MSAMDGKQSEHISIIVFFDRNIIMGRKNSNTGTMPEVLTVGTFEVNVENICRAMFNLFEVGTLTERYSLFLAFIIKIYSKN